MEVWHRTVNGDEALRTSRDKEGSPDVGSSSISGVSTGLPLKGGPDTQLTGLHDAGEGLRDTGEEVLVVI